MIKIFVAAIFLVMTFSSCSENEIQLLPGKQYTFLCLSHTYVRGLDFMDVEPLTKQIDYKKYDLLLMGGDLLEHTTQYADTFAWLNTIFHLDKSTTLWAPGNHDYDNVQMIRNLNGGPLYYARYFNGITFLVLDTQDSLSNFVGDQLELIKNVTDTLQMSSQLIILMHKLVWMTDGHSQQSIADSVCNGGLGTCFYCLNENNFYTDVYPRIVNLKRNGINVTCIGGDIGLNVQKYEYKTPEGIIFLATGICSGCAINYGLRFKWMPSANELSYEYVLLTELVEEWM